MEGKHHHISGEMARKYGVPEEVAHAAEAHHDDLRQLQQKHYNTCSRRNKCGSSWCTNISAENFAERCES